MEKKKLKVLEVKQEIAPFKTPKGNEVRSITLLVEGIDDKNRKLKFYSHKKDTDEETVAYKGFKTGKVVKGAELEISWNESEEKEFNGHKYKDRYVAFFDGLSNLEDKSEEVEENDISQIPF